MRNLSQKHFVVHPKVLESTKIQLNTKQKEKKEKKRKKRKKRKKIRKTLTPDF